MQHEVMQELVPGHSLQASRVYIVRSVGPDGAVARLQSEPLLRSVGRVSATDALLVPVNSAAMEQIPDGSWLAFHYQDFPAIAAIRALRQSRVDLTVACLCSDLYAYRHYTNSYDIVDVFIVPTQAHKRVLAFQMPKPVEVVPEAIDSIIPLATAGTPAVNKRLTWFGYAESFAKGMASVIPAIRSAVSAGTIDGFDVITNLEEFRVAGLDLSGISRRQYVIASFVDDLRQSSYALLSHMPLDLELNSFIKSPNKLVTSLMCGLVPLCSDTPNYAEILTRFGLQEFIFSSPTDFASMLRRLDPERDLRKIQESGIIAFVRDEYAEENVARRFIAVMERTQSSKAAELPALNTYAVPRTASLGEHLRDLVPSARRAFSARAAMVRHRWLRR